MKPRSVNYFVTITFLAGLALLSLIGISMAYRIQVVDKAFYQNHVFAANNELRHGISVVMAKVQDIASAIALWDETSQQLTDPTYYTFWRQQRVHAVKFIPIYVYDIELYNLDGLRLQSARDSGLPPKIQQADSFLNIERGYAWLYLFKPVMLSNNSTQVFGYVGMKVDFLAALLDSNIFTHIDISSVNFIPRNAKSIDPDNIIDHIRVLELHKGETDQLKQVTYETFGYIVVLILLVTMLVYWMVFMLFAKPLNQLNQYVNDLEESSLSKHLKNQQLNFTVSEFNHFARSFAEFHERLVASQLSLQKLNIHLEQRVESRTLELQSINRELEAFSYSVSHDLRAPLRRIDGFCRALLEDYNDRLDKQGQEYLERVIYNTRQMAELIDDLLNLSRIARMDMNITRVELSDLVKTVLKQLQEQNPGRHVAVSVQENVFAYGDKKLLTVLLDNIVSNAWKYTGKTPEATIEFGSRQQDYETVYYVKDNGAGFDMQYVDKIFEVFQRLHGSEFEGTGIGLATAFRIVKRHNGAIWAESEIGKGASFYFTLHPVVVDSEYLPVVPKSTAKPVATVVQS